MCSVKRDRRVVDDLAAARSAFPSTASEAEPLRAAVQAHLEAVRRVGRALRALGADDPGDNPIPGVLPMLEVRAPQGDEQIGSWSRLDGTWSLIDTFQPLSLLRENDLQPPDDPADLGDLEAACRAARQRCWQVWHALAAFHVAQANNRLGDDGELAGRTIAAAGGEDSPALYLALLVQDSDDIGDHLADPDDDLLAGRSLQHWHQDVSRMLARLAADQVTELENAFGRAVYAGGDDLLGLLPAAYALRVAVACRALLGTHADGLLRRPTASTAIVFFHYSYPLQEALRRSRDALRVAKGQEGKDTAAVVVLRRGGERATALLPWSTRGASLVASMDALTGLFRGPLSARLLTDMTRERHGLAELARDGLTYHREVIRLIARHHSTSLDGPPANLVRLVTDLEPVPQVRTADDVTGWVGGLEVARFLAQEAR